MAHDAIAFIAAMDLGQVDLLGLSIGSFVAQQVVLTRPAIARRLILASAAPQGAAGMHGWSPEVIGAIGTPENSPGDTSTSSSPDLSDSAHGFLFQHHAEFAADVEAFLSEPN